MNYVLSYPRSGVTWFRYCVEELTERPTLGASKADHPICSRNGVDLNVDPNKNYVLFKRHWWNGEEFEKDDVLFLIIRNPVEILSRHYISDDHDIDKILNHDAKEYVKNIEKFENFEGAKYQFYYEDLIEDEPLRKILQDVKQFLPFKKGKIDKFMKKIEYHRKQSLDSYPKSHTKGKKKIYHQKNVSDDQRRQFSERVKNLMGDKVYRKYLKKY